MTTSPSSGAAAPAELPAFTDDDLARIEAAVFAQIAEERAGSTARTAARRGFRRRGWLVAGGIAAAFVVGVLVAPSVLSPTGTASSGSSVAAPSVPGATPQDSAKSLSSGAAPLSGTTAGTGKDASGSRDIVRSGSTTLQVSDVTRAADALGALAEKHHGYVESRQIGSAAPTPTEGTRLLPATPAGDGSVSLRVPADDLGAVMDGLRAYGTVLASSMGQNDVTATTTDLRAQVEALTTSVARLQQLMSQASSVADLLTAESALTERQSQLQSAQQQLKDLESQVQMSSLQITLVRDAPAAADPAGFGDGIAAGWHGLIVALNALVIAVGFLLPWLGVVAIVLLLVWGILRARRTRRRASVSRPSDDPVD